MAEINLGNDTDLNVSLDEQTNLSANVYDINYIPDYVKAEQERRANETIRIANENQRIGNEEARQNYYDLIQQKVEDGDFDGEDGVSPVVTTSKTDGVTTITIQDVEGTKTATILDGVNGNKVYYGEITTKPTISGTTVKIEATTDNDYTLEKGSLIVVKYTLPTITYSGYGYTLNVNGTGEKTIYWGTTSRPAAAGDSNFYGNGQTWLFVYDGTYYRAVETRFASTSTFGFTKLSDSVSSTSSDLSATPKAVKQAYDKATSVETAAKNDYAHTLTMSYTPSTKSVNVGIANYNGSVLDSGAVELNNLATTDSVDALNDYVFGEDSVSGEGTSLQLTDTLNGKLKSVECKGDTYQNGTPTPSSPIPINVVSGDNEINICGKNLCPDNFTNGYFNNNTGLIAGHSNNHVSYENYIKVQPNTTYTFSHNHVITGSFTTMVFQYGKDKSFLIRNNNYSNSLTFTTTSQTEYVNLSIYDSSGASLDNFTGQLEVGSSSTTYEPYIGNTYPISLGTIELCKIGDYQDYIYKDNGSWYLHKEIGKVVLDGSENWFQNSTYQNVYGIDNILENAITIETRPMLSDYFTYGGLINSGSGSVQINKFYQWTGIPERIILGYNSTSLSDFKTWLGTHNTSVYYPLATPTNTLIEDTTLIEQLEALSSVNGITNINQENNDLPMILNVEAFKNNLNGKLGLLDILVKE